MNVALWIAQCLLACAYGTVGSMKVLQPAKVRKRPQMTWAHDRSDPYIRFVGTMEVLGAAGLVLPMLTGILPWLTPLSAVGLSLIQVLAIATAHLPKKEYGSLPLNAVFLGLSLFIVFGRWVLFLQLASEISMSLGKFLYALFAAQFSRVAFY